MTIEQEVSYGLDFAFEFALTNPLRTPPSADNAADPGVLFCLRRSPHANAIKNLEEYEDLSINRSHTYGKMQMYLGFMC